MPTADHRSERYRALGYLGYAQGSTAEPWVVRMLARKQPMLVIVALANKMARIVWTLMASVETYPAAKVKRSV